MKIGIPKEIIKGERRVSVVPKIAVQLIRDEHEVFVESNAGEDAYFSDTEYKSVGAGIVKDTQLLYSESDVIMKVQPPQSQGSGDDEKWFNLYRFSRFCL